MDTLTLRPNATSDHTDDMPASNPSLGWEAWQNVDEVIPDEDASYLYIIQGSYYTHWNYPNHTTETGIISKVKVTCRCRTFANYGRVRAVIKTGGSLYYSAYSNLTTSYVNYIGEWTVNPKTGLAWTWDEIDALQAGASLWSNTLGTKRCTQIFVEVEYSGVSIPVVTTKEATLVQ